MALVVIDVTCAPPSLAGTLQRRMLEVRAGLFVGALGRRSIEQIWCLLTESGAKSAVMIYPAKNESGFRMMQFGEHDYVPVDNFGVQLIRFHRLKVGKKVAASQAND